MKQYISILLAFLFITSCTTSRYSDRHDSAPIRPPTSLELKDAQITNEGITGSTKPYTVFGKRYVPMTKRQALTQTGIASWYGKKFHGHLTSNGEIYNMYGMTAAHKTLPLPSFVKVTNLSNNESVIVRVNDRGPFHQDRIIDLSYSAAYKIGVYDTGTAKVKIEVVNEVPQKQYTVKISNFATLTSAQESAKGISFMIDRQVKTEAEQQTFSLIFAPFEKRVEAEDFANTVKKFGFDHVIVTSSHL